MQKRKERKESDTEQSEFGGKFAVTVLRVEDTQTLFLQFNHSTLNVLDYN